MTGAHFPVRLTQYVFTSVLNLPSTETMAEHRARSLSALLPIALATGYSEIEPDLEPLKVSFSPNPMKKALTSPP
jgi:hypothetical protein